MSGEANLLFPTKAAQHATVRTEQHQPVVIDQIAIGVFQHLIDSLAIREVRTGHARRGKSGDLDTLQKSGLNLPFTLGEKNTYLEGRTIWTLHDATKRVRIQDCS